MKIIELIVELVPVKEVLINGSNVQSTHGKHMLEEKIFAKELSLDQQYMVMCEVRQLLAKMLDAHTRRKAFDGELSFDDAADIMKERRKIRSGSGGVKGTDIGPLIPGR